MSLPLDLAIVKPAHNSASIDRGEFGLSNSIAYGKVEKYNLSFVRFPLGSFTHELQKEGAEGMSEIMCNHEQLAKHWLFRVLRNILSQRPQPINFHCSLMGYPTNKELDNQAKYLQYAFSQLVSIFIG